MAALAIAAALVARQPLAAPWWVTADADATYTASGLNLLLGNHTSYLDHPGLPQQEALALVFGAQYLVEKAVGKRADGRVGFASDTLLHLDRARPVYRTLAIVFYLLGVALTFVLASRLLGHWTWGLAGSLLWLGAPGLLAISLQIRPDALLCVLVIAATYLTARAAQQRDPWLFACASATVGFAMTAKLHAAGVVPALAAAAVWRHPGEGWQRRFAASARAALRRNRLWLIPAGAAFGAAAVILNLHRPTFVLTDDQRTLLLTIVAFVGGYIASAAVVRRFALIGARLFDPFYALLMVSVLCGIAIPVALVVDDGLQMMVSIKNTLTGHGVNEGVKPFTQSAHAFVTFPLAQALAVFAVAIAGAIVGLVRRDAVPVVFGVAAAALGVMAFARLESTYYYAPAYVAAIPAALWLVRGSRPRVAPLLIWPLVAIVLIPQLWHRDDTARNVAGQEQRVRAVEQVVGPRLGDGEVALTPIAVPDTSFGWLVQFYADYKPAYPFRFVPPEARFIRLVRDNGMTVRYYVGPAALGVAGVADVSLDGLGTFHVQRLRELDDPQGSFGVLEILGLPAGL